MKSFTAGTPSYRIISMSATFPRTMDSFIQLHKLAAVHGLTLDYDVAVKVIIIWNKNSDFETKLINDTVVSKRIK